MERGPCAERKPLCSGNLFDATWAPSSADLRDTVSKEAQPGRHWARVDDRRQTHGRSERRAGLGHRIAAKGAAPSVIETKL
jgi:hypothetical protein